MAWTLRDYQDRVLSLVVDQTPNPGDITVWVNQCLQELQRDARLEASGTLTLVPNMAEYTLPTDLYELKHLYSPTTGYPVRPLDQFDLTSQGDRLSGMGYRLWDGKLILQPTPSAAQTLKLEYYKLVNQLAAATDTPNIPEEWHDLPYLYAAMRAKQQDAEFGEGQQYQFEYQQRRMDFKAQQLRHRKTAFRRVRLVSPWE